MKESVAAVSFKVASNEVEQLMKDIIEEQSTVTMKEIQDMDPEDLEHRKRDYQGMKSMINYIEAFNEMLIDIAENQQEIIKKLEKMEMKAK